MLTLNVVWYEVSCGYTALIEIVDLLKVVPFFWTTLYILHWYKSHLMKMLSELAKKKQKQSNT